jgi:hypothetical protein
MTKEEQIDPRERKCYYDEKGVEIGEGDLLKIYHFRHYIRKEKMYMYQIAILQESQGTFWWAAKDYNREGEKGHYWLKSVADKTTGIIHGTEIIYKKDYENADRLKREGSKRIKHLSSLNPHQ